MSTIMVGSKDNAIEEIEPAEEEIYVMNSVHVAKEEKTTSLKLKPLEKKALLQLKIKLEKSILDNSLFQDKLCKKSRRQPNCLANSCSMDLTAKENLKSISLWGVPLFPSKYDDDTNVILLQFLKAREFKVSDAFEMLRKTLRWRKEFEVDGILEEDLGSDLENVIYMDSIDKEGHPLCYNIYGAFEDKTLYNKVFGTEEKNDKFLRWLVQFMEKGVQKLSFKAREAGYMVQITDLNNLLGQGQSMKELRFAVKNAITLLQENYPEIFARNIMINVPFWYYAYHTLFCRFLTNRMKRKFIFARPSKVTETLLKFIVVENIPVQYGGLKREDDEEFSSENGRAMELIVKGGGTAIIEIPTVEAGMTLLWDITVVGWEVKYKEEFIPDDEGSYKVLIQKKKKMVESVRNSFYIAEPGKVVLTIYNSSFKKKRVLYRSKTKPTVPMYIFFR